MAKQPMGTVSMAKSDTALFANITYRLEGKGVDELDAYARDELRIAVRADVIRRAPGTASRLAALPAGGKSTVLNGVRVDMRALDFFQAFVRLRVTAKAGLLLVTSVAGVLQAFSIQETNEVVALVVYERRSDRDHLRLKLAEVADVISWEQIDEESQEGASRTWRAITHAAAVREKLTRPV